jgi:hypothetical protein
MIAYVIAHSRDVTPLFYYLREWQGVNGRVSFVALPMYLRTLNGEISKAHMHVRTGDATVPTVKAHQTTCARTCIADGSKLNTPS